MGSALYAIGIFILFFILCFGNYAQFAWTVMRWTKKPKREKGSGKLIQPKLTMKERLIGCIPIYQAALVRKALYKRAPISTVMAIIAMVLIVIRLVNTFLITINSYVMFATVIGIFIALIIMFFLYGLITADCAKMYNMSWFTILLCFLFPMVFCYRLTNNIPHKMLDLRKAKTFEENHGNTHIKQKSNK